MLGYESTNVVRASSLPPTPWDLGGECQVNEKLGIEMHILKTLVTWIQIKFVKKCLQVYTFHTADWTDAFFSLLFFI
jgi:hypothetical protein